MTGAGRPDRRRRGRLLLLVVLGSAVALASTGRTAGDGDRPSVQKTPPPGVPELERALEALTRAGTGEPEGEGTPAGEGVGLREALADREAELARKEQEIATLREKLRRLEEKTASLETALAATREALADRDGEIEEQRRALLRTLKERERELAILRRDNLSLTEKLARLREDKRRIAEERARLRIDLENAERQITELTASLEQAWKERDAADGEVEARDVRALDRDKRLARLEDRLAAVERERDELRGRLADLEKALARADEREGILSEERARYRGAVSAATSALEEAAARLRRATADLRAREAALVALEEANAELSRALDEARELADRYRRILEALRERFEPDSETPAPAEIVPEAGPPTATAEDDSEGVPAARAGERRIPATVLAGTVGTADFRTTAADLGFFLRTDERGRPVTVLEEVRFAFDSTELTTESLPVLARLAELLRRFPAVRAIVAGHTDAAGDADYNRALSRARAEEVRRLLVETHGIAADRLRAVGYGEDRPLASNEDAEGRRRNRRVEVQFELPPSEGNGTGGG